MAEKSGSSGGLKLKMNPVAIIGMVMCVVGLLLFFAVSMVIGIIVMVVGAIVAIVGIVQSSRAAKG